MRQIFTVTAPRSTGDEGLKGSEGRNETENDKRRSRWRGEVWRGVERGEEERRGEEGRGEEEEEEIGLPFLL